MIELQPFTRNDYDRLISWVDSAETLMQFAGPAFTFPLTDEQLDESTGDVNRIAFKVVVTTADDVIGHAEIYLTGRCAYLGRILIGDERLRGKGIGLKIVQALLQIVFEDLQQNLVVLNVFDWNTAAIKCYKKAGFSINREKLTERTVNGKRWRVLNMTLTKEEWQQLRNASKQKQ